MKDNVQVIKNNGKKKLPSQSIDQSVKIRAESWSGVRHVIQEDETMMTIL